MITLKVKEFSCIKQAELVLGDITVLIGPQATGKSVLSKLVYFFIQQIQEQHIKVRQNVNFNGFIEAIRANFTEWFPISAWGNKTFVIEFSMGEYKLRVTRTSYAEEPRDNLRVWASPLVREGYKTVQDLAKSLHSSAKSRPNHPPELAGLEISWRLQDAALSALSRLAGDDFVAFQTFVPAGRSFFTTMGRMLLAFDQGRQLDPVTAQFGMMYASMQEELQMVHYSRDPMLKEIGEMLGGEIVWENDRASFRCKDGRTVPFSALSSGQQELLPLFMIGWRLSLGRKQGTGVFYIEEPEAHLFPESQSKLIEALIRRTPKKTRLFLTTHSPYVLAKINNLIKAGQLAKNKPEKSKEINNIIEEALQLPADHVRAYAICDGTLKPLISKDSEWLIESDYLDSISGDIAKEFEQLLSLEFFDVDGELH